MTQQRQSLTLAFAQAIAPATAYYLSNWKDFSPDWVAGKVFDYAEALADEFIDRQGKWKG